MDINENSCLIGASEIGWCKQDCPSGIVLIEKKGASKTKTKYSYIRPVSRILGFVRAAEGSLIDLALWYGVSVSICACLLLYGKYLWWAYIQTQLGHEYTVIFVEKASSIELFFDQDLGLLSVQLSWIIMKAALVLGTASQGLFLTGLFYDNKEGIGRFFVWMLPFACVIAWHISELLGLTVFSSFVLVFFPSISLLHACMTFTSKVLPYGFLLRVLWRILAECRYLLRKRV